MSDCEVEKVLKRISEREVERRKQKQAKMSVLREKYGNSVVSVIARAEKTSRRSSVIFEARHDETRDTRFLVSKSFAEWSESQRAKSREKQIREYLADPKI